MRRKLLVNLSRYLASEVEQHDLLPSVEGVPSPVEIAFLDSYTPSHRGVVYLTVTTSCIHEIIDCELKDLLIQLE